MKRTITQTEQGIFIRFGGMPKPRPHSHQWFVNNGETHCGVCGKRHPSEAGKGQ